jgi:hypothetical protein
MCSMVDEYDLYCRLYSVENSPSFQDRNEAERKKIDDLSSIITPRKPPPRKSSAHQLSKPRNHRLKSTETCSDEVQQSCDTYRIVFAILLVGITHNVIIHGTQSVVRTQSGNAREFRPVVPTTKMRLAPPHFTEL